MHINTLWRSGFLVLFAMPSDALGTSKVEHKHFCTWDALPCSKLA